MEASIKQQASELIKSSSNILLVTHKNPDGDALGSLLALKIALEKLGKKITAVTADTPNKIFDFLPGVGEIKRKIEGSSDFILSLDVSKTEIAKIGYKKDEREKKVNIIISPRENGKFNPEDLKISDSKPKFDLIISVDTPNLERLGEIAIPADLYYETPVINIDHHPSNEKFGKINLVELVATSSAEILVSLFESLSKDTQLIDEKVATCLLTGLIYDTSSFQNVNTTPKSLTVAAQLVAAGGKQQEIVKNLYKTKSMETLKLWGLVLTKVREDRAHKFLWSSVSKEEIVATGADEGALSGVVDELLKSASDVDFAILLSERDGYLHGSLRSIAKGVNVANIAESFGGGGHEVAAAFRIEGDLKSKEQEILAKIAKIQEKNSGEPIQKIQEKTNGGTVEETISGDKSQLEKSGGGDVRIDTKEIESDAIKALNSIEEGPVLGDAETSSVSLATPVDDSELRKEGGRSSDSKERVKTKW